jgi:glutamine cyclotransferase
VKTISVAGNKEVYNKLNELEYHNGFIYSNIWHKPVVLKLILKRGSCREI